MNILKNIFAAAFLFLAGSAAAQHKSALERLYDDFSASCITMEVDYAVELSSTQIKGEAMVVTQDNAYVMKGNGIESYCNGKDIWTLDLSAKEVYIESVGEGTEAYMNNPVLLFQELSTGFKVVQEQGGRMFTLVPSYECGIDECCLRFNTEGRLAFGSFVMDDGNIVSVTVNSIRKSDKKDVSFYCPTLDFDSSWIVTDLR